MRLVLDTNVLVSALLSPYRPPARVLDQLLQGSARLCYDARILAEYRQVLVRPKFGFENEAIAALVDYLEARGELVASQPLGLSLPDPADAMFLEVAVAARADCLVTGNLRHFPADRRAGVRVVSPAELTQN